MVLRVAVALTLMGVLFVLSSIPGRARPGDRLLVRIAARTPPLVQKTLHVLFYGGLSWLWFWALAPLPLQLPNRLLAAFLIAAGFGAFNEWHQIRLPDRYGSLADVALNSTGAGLGLLLAVFLAE